MRDVPEIHIGPRRGSLSGLRWGLRDRENLPQEVIIKQALGARIR
jgi:hypothetical protein